MPKQKAEKKNPIHIGKRMYGTIPKEEAFNKALEPYFKEKEKKLTMS